MSKQDLTISRKSIKDFLCWDDRIKDLGWEFSMIGGTHRDADLVDRCNAIVIKQELEKVDPNEEYHGVLRASHWAVGWYDHLIVDTTNSDIMGCLKSLKDSLDNYPLLDEDLYSEMEFNEHEEYGCDHSDCQLCCE